MPTSRTILVIGIRGSGKTHLVKHEILPQHNPVLIFDTIGEYEDIPGFSDVESEADLLDLIEIGENIRVEYNQGIDFDRVCFVLNHVQEKYTLLIDEFHVLYQHHMSFQMDVPNFKPLFLLGNHNNVSMILITQRPTDFPKFVLTQCTTLYSFHIWHKADIEFINNIIDNPEQFRELEMFQYKRVDFVAPISITQGMTSLS